MEELKRQRDLAQSQVDELRRKLQNDQQVCSLSLLMASSFLSFYLLINFQLTFLCLFIPIQISNPLESPRPSVKKCLSYSDVLSPKPDGKELGRNDKVRKTMLRQSMRQSSTAPFTLMHEIRKLEHLQEQLGDEANRALEVLQKEVACHRLGNQDAAETIAKLQAEIREMRAVRSITKAVEVGTAIAPNRSVSANLKEEITRLHSQGSTIANLEEQLENVQKSIDKLVMSLPSNNQESNSEATHKTKNQSKKKKLLPLTSSNVANRQNFIKSPCSPLSTSRQIVEPENEENRPPEDDDIVFKETLPGSEKETPMKSEEVGDVSSKEGTPGYRRSSSVNMKKMQKMFQNAAEENVRSIRAYVTELKERVAKLQYQKQLLVCQVKNCLFPFYMIYLAFSFPFMGNLFSLLLAFRCLSWKQMKQLDTI